MDFLFVDPLQRMDPDYIRAWWERFEAEERLLGEMGLPMPEPPWNAPGWIVETSGADAASISGTEQAAGAVPPSSEMDGSQALVVAHTTGPALVMAGAGSGKTRTITARVVRLLEKGVAPNEILCLTFTRKAAREMRERIEKKMGEGAKKITISTFHALALDLLGDAGEGFLCLFDFFVFLGEKRKRETKSAQIIVIEWRFGFGLLVGLG